MGNLINTLRQLVREEIAIHEDRLGKGLTIANAEKAKKIKQLYPEGHYIVKIIDAIEGATDYDMTRLGYKDPKTGNFIKGLAQILDMKHTRFNPQIKDLILSGVLADKAETAIPKKEKPEATGQRGRKPSDTSREGIIRVLFQKFQDNPEYSFSEEDITYSLPKGLGTEKLTQDQISKIKNKALGLSKRGRPAKIEDKLLDKVNKALSERSLHEVYKKLQKLK